MKLYAECIACQINVRMRDVERFVDDEDKRVEIMKHIVEIVNSMLQHCENRYDNSCIPTIIATNLFRYIKKYTGLVDPYKEIKKKTNLETLKIYSEIKQEIKKIYNPKEKLLLAIRLSLIGNALDIGVIGYTPPHVNDIMNLAAKLNVYGDIELIVNILKNAKSFVILMDNCGEAVLDRVLADVLRSLGKKVIAIVKSGAFQNDITIEDVIDAGLHESFDLVIDTGADASSIFLDEVKPEVLSLLNEVDVIIAKGMANYEYISEIVHMLKKPVIYMLIAKCAPIARDLGIPVGGAIVKVDNYKN